MGMGQKHYRFHGTKAEIDGMLAVIPQYAADRWIEKPHKIYQHMIDQLGVEIWECCVSKAQFTARVVDPLQAFAAQHPKMLWSITYARSGVVIDNGLERFCNYLEADPSFPGPFGALCKAYGVNYFPTEELRLANVERYNLLMAAKERNAAVQSS